MGAASLRGRAHARNEDAVAVRHGRRGTLPFAALVVCDGVTSSSHGDQAAAAAAEAALEVITSALEADAPSTESDPEPRPGETPGTDETPWTDVTPGFHEQPELTADQRRHLLRTAVHLAHEAVCAAPIEELADRDPPGTTLVAALVHDGRVDVAWVGDSRAYLLSPARADEPGELCVLLTHDHSWVNLVVDRGDMSEADATAAPLAHAITRCIGPLHDPDPARPAEVSLSHSVMTPGSRVVLCSDGVWGFADSPTAFCQLVSGLAPEASAGDLAEALVARAVEHGGEDDMTVAVSLIGG